MKNLKVKYYVEGCQNKLLALEEIIMQEHISWQEIAYVGDDWPDLMPMQKVGLAVAVNNAQPEVKEHAHYITNACGGHGAVREVVRLILEEQGLLNSLLAKWTLII